MAKRVVRNADMLTALLREAKVAHGEYERRTGKADEDWPTWYAMYIFQSLPKPDNSIEWE